MMYAIEMSRLIKASPNIVWDVISDNQLFGVVAPNLHHIDVLSGNGAGMRRRCTGNDGDSWTEQCTLWQPEQIYVFEVDSHSARYPFAKMRGTFQQESRPDGVLVTMLFDFVPKFNPPLLGWLMIQFLRPSSLKLCKAIFDGWEAEIKKRDFKRQAA
jgi:hypothetical protein